MAARALVDSANPRVTGALGTMLKDRVWQVRVAAAETLATARDVVNADPLRAALKDESAAVREASIRALAKHGDVDDLEALRAALEDPIVNVQVAATAAIEEIERSAESLTGEGLPYTDATPSAGDR